MYCGKDCENRRTTIDSLAYRDFTVISTDGARTLSQLASGVPEDTEVCVFWADDGKPVSPNFLRDMVAPLNDNGTDMHLWSGNALAMPCSTLHAVGKGEFVFKVGSFLKLALLYLDATFASRGRRAHVAFSSTEKLAPMCAEPVGLPS
jgi:hypothetical protein